MRSLLLFFALSFNATASKDQQDWDHIINDASKVASLQIEAVETVILISEQKGKVFKIEFRGMKDHIIDFNNKDAKNLSLKIKLPKKKTADLANFISQKYQSQLKIIIPKGKKLSLNVSNVSGDLVAKRLISDDLNFQTVSGNLNIRNFKGSMNFNSVSGDLKIVKLYGDVEMNTVSGQVVIQKIFSGSEQLKFQSVSGNLHLGFQRGVFPNITFDSDSGKMINPFNVSKKKKKSKLIFASMSGNLNIYKN